MLISEKFKLQHLSDFKNGTQAIDSRERVARAFCRRNRTVHPSPWALPAAMSKQIEEELEVGFRAVYRIDKILHSGSSAFQTVDVVDLAPFGRTLLIDGMIQSCQVTSHRADARSA